MRQFLAAAADLGVAVVYGRFLDLPSPHHHALIQPAPGDTVLVLQYPASGGVVHNWTGPPAALGEPVPRTTPSTSGR
ncbi:hypothetical protein [Saccharothrix sp.]|uniref:hypothetical protein n=1 Tax=Saccharothrix sp. TaxID=1873460 RepID=UPI0028120544|nr:hypothetical protein [Saccharothrix sp.]